MVDLVRVVPLRTVHLTRGAGKYRCEYREVKSSGEVRKGTVHSVTIETPLLRVRK